MELMELKTRCPRTAFLSGDSREESVSLLVRVVGRIQFFVIVRLKIYNLAVS